MASISEMSESKLLYTMVNTRIKTKFVKKDGNRLVNPLPGTILDHSVLKKDAYDFFLISTNCRQGVPTPSHYTVLIDETGKGPEEIQKFVYKLSYMYYNFSGAVKIPAPMKYSTRLATMISENGISNPHERFDSIKGLYFI